MVVRKPAKCWLQNLAGSRTPAKVENKGDPNKARERKRGANCGEENGGLTTQKELVGFWVSVSDLDLFSSSRETTIFLLDTPPFFPGIRIFPEHHQNSLQVEQLRFSRKEGWLNRMDKKSTPRNSATSNNVHMGLSQTDFPQVADLLGMESTPMLP